MIFDMLDPRMWIAAAAASAIVAAGSYGKGRIDGAAKVQVRWDHERAVQLEAARVATAKNAGTQIEWSHNAVEAQLQKARDEAATADLRTRLAATERRLRDYAAAGRGGVPAPTSSACDSSLAATRRDLAECGAERLSVAAELAGREAEIAELVTAWPTQP